MIRWESIKSSNTCGGNRMWLDSRLPFRRAGFESHVTPEVNVDFLSRLVLHIRSTCTHPCLFWRKERKEGHISPRFLPTAGLIHNEKAAICARKRPLWSLIPAGPVSGSRLMLHHYKNHLQQRPTGACADSIRQFPHNASMEALIFFFLEPWGRIQCVGLHSVISLLSATPP